MLQVNRGWFLESYQLEPERLIVKSERQTEQVKLSEETFPADGPDVRGPLF